MHNSFFYTHRLFFSNWVQVVFVFVFCFWSFREVIPGFVKDRSSIVFLFLTSAAHDHAIDERFEDITPD